MKQSVQIKYCLVLLFACAISLFSCNNDDDVAPAAGSNEAINSWIYDQLAIYYYWENQLPAKSSSNLNPEDYFNSLIYSQEDRFSWIQPNYQELLNSLQGVSKEAGYEFILYSDTIPNGVLGQISYIKSGSPAATQDIKRGDVFKEINGTRLTLDNFQSVLSSIRNNHSIDLIRYNNDANSWEDVGTRDLTTVELAENPNFLDTVYTINEKKIGYYVYNFFATGTTSNQKIYENEMNSIFQKFQGEAIDHLILDLRYNSGGAESATIDLASHIGSNVSENDIFVKRDFNSFLNQYYKEEFGDEALIRKFESNPINIGNQLVNQRVTILTSSRSASASELLINGLLPYMDVFLIGDKTVGKNVGSFSLYDDEDPENTWGMQPIVSKSFNSLDQSDYSTGFIPNIQLKDNVLVKKELGDINELLLAAAIQQITGIIARENNTISQQTAVDIYSSLESKRSYGIYTIDIPPIE